MQKIIVTRRWPAAAEESLSRLGEVHLNTANQPFDTQALKAAFAEADIVCCTVTDRITAEVIGDSPRTRLIANFGVGFNHIDLDAAAAAGIAVTNTPGVLTTATAEIAMALILMVARRTGAGERLVRAGEWTGWHPTHMLSTQVSGKTLGIVGLGRIGTKVAQQAHHGFGMQILYTGRRQAAPEVADTVQAAFVTLDELLARSDFISLHCPATPHTRHMINAHTLAKMQSHAFLVNTARGDVVDEPALVKALQAGQIAGAGLDVYEQEPQLAAGLAALDNVVVLPHMGSGTEETRAAMGQCAVDNVAAFVNDEPLPNRVGGGNR